MQTYNVIKGLFDLGHDRGYEKALSDVRGFISSMEWMGSDGTNLKDNIVEYIKGGLEFYQNKRNGQE